MNRWALFQSEQLHGKLVVQQFDLLRMGNSDHWTVPLVDPAAYPYLVAC